MSDELFRKTWLTYRNAKPCKVARIVLVLVMLLFVAQFSSGLRLDVARACVLTAFLKVASDVRKNQIVTELLMLEDGKKS